MSSHESVSFCARNRCLRWRFRTNHKWTSYLTTTYKVNYLQDLILHSCTFSAINRKRQGKGNTEKPIFGKGNSGTASNYDKWVKKCKSNGGKGREEGRLVSSIGILNMPSSSDGAQHICNDSCSREASVWEEDDRGLGAPTCAFASSFANSFLTSQFPSSPSHPAPSIKTNTH